MVQRGFWMLLLFVCLMCGCSSIPDRISMRERNVVSRIVEDHGEFYDSDTLGGLGRGIILASAVANTTADRELHASFQTSVRGATTDDWFDFLHANETLGDGAYTLPIMAGAWGLGVLLPEDTHTTAMREWGERSMRSFLVGAPPLIALQKATGGSRPGEVENASKWRPFRDNNGVSGHSFMSALPFLTAAKMTRDSRWKAALYAGSTLGSLSRVNDEAHYPSQAALGWWLAYLATSAIDESDSERPWDILCNSEGFIFGASIDY